MCACMCGSRGLVRPATREERIKWLEDYQRDLQQQAAEVADKIKNLKESS